MDRTNVIKNLMKQKGLKVSDIAKLTGIPYTTIKSILDRGVDKAGYSNIVRICEALQISSDDFKKPTQANFVLENTQKSTLSINNDTNIFELYNQLDKKKAFIKGYIKALVDTQGE